MKKNSIVFIGSLKGNTRSKQRKLALEELVHKVEALSYIPEDTPESTGKNIPLIERILWKLGFPLAKNPINRMLLDAVKEIQPNVLWIEKGNSIFPSTLQKVKQLSPNCQVVSYTEDDMFAFHNRSWFYTWGFMLETVMKG
jgi:spore maturation protein CgeB